MKKFIYSGYSQCNYCSLRIIIICYDKKRKQEKTLRSRKFINYFSVHDPSNRERSRSFEASMPHGYEIRDLDWINLLRNLNLGSYCFTDRKLVAEPHHIKVSLSLRCRCRKRSQWGKKQKLIMLNSKFGLKFDGFFLK